MRLYAVAALPNIYVDSSKVGKCTPDLSSRTKPLVVVGECVMGIEKGPRTLMLLRKLRKLIEVCVNRRHTIQQLAMVAQSQM